MKHIIISILLLCVLLSGCSKPADTEKPDMTEIAQVTQTANSGAEVKIETTAVLESGAIGYGEFSMYDEKLGDLALGLDEQQVKNILGLPGMTTEPDYWGSDGLMHKTWEYPQMGIEIGFIESGRIYVVERISVRHPFEGATSRGISIGSSEADVIAIYGDYISEQDSQIGYSIVVGSIYGGIIFSIENDIVTGIFIGAAAE